HRCAIPHFEEPLGVVEDDGAAEEVYAVPALLPGLVRLEKWIVTAPDGTMELAPAAAQLANHAIIEKELFDRPDIERTFDLHLDIVLLPDERRGRKPRPGAERLPEAERIKIGGLHDEA